MVPQRCLIKTHRLHQTSANKLIPCWHTVHSVCVCLYVCEIVNVWWSQAIYRAVSLPLTWTLTLERA